MKLSYNWLNDFADFKSIPFEKIYEKISLSICEIDDVSEYREHLSTIVSAKVVEVKKHPDADKLSVCVADIGTRKIQIVTGAQVAEGEIVPLAMIGTVFPDGKEIKEGKLRGVDSFGMFCSEKELGLSEEATGLMKLAASTKLGVSLRQLLDSEDKIILIDNKSITHRPDLWSHFGFARELAAQLGIKIKYDPFETEFLFSNDLSPKVFENDNAHSYFAANVKGFTIKDSIPKIKDRLLKCGIKSINNVVDISNYVMLEMGQPTHFFDKAKLGDVAIEVKYAKNKDKISLLDKTERELDSAILVISNAGVPVAIAGVMGGDTSAISNTTIEAILESAVFKREDVRKTIRATGIRTESAVRYEKGLDSHSSLPVINRSLELLKENGCPALTASKPAGFEHKKEKQEIRTTFTFLNAKLGTIFEKKVIVDILQRLGFHVSTKEDDIVVIVPHYRHNYDITIEEDLVEEVGRSLGYAAIERKPLLSDVKPVTKNSKREIERAIKQIFTHNLGYSEVFNYSFASEEDTKFESEDSTALGIANSMPDEFKFLRTSIYPSILKHIAVNADRFETVKIFELGRTYHKIKADELASEKRFFGFGVLRNRKSNELVDAENDFLAVRNDIDTLFRLFGFKNIVLEKGSLSYFHPNACLQWKLNEEVIAELGFLHPKYNDAYNVKRRVLIGKLFFDAIERLNIPENKKFTFVPPSHFPQDQMDISLVMDRAATTENYAQLVSKLGVSEIQSVWVHDIYTGQNISPDKKSVTYRIALMNYKETFTQAAIKEITDKLINLAKDNGYLLR
ncbi:MAG: phenylalanine--tRNA ligase subunit beta [Leptospiraceae bacterium]|nr:phenylalanine--tRNA ligase subunit beta [Leptospiraceae bacterium]